MSDLSSQQRLCVDYMQAHQGKIFRHRNGCWGCKNCWSPGHKSFTTTTVESLIKQGFVNITDWQRSPQGVNYAGEVELKETT